MGRQDVGGAIPLNCAGARLPVEGGGAGSLRRQAQLQFFLQRSQRGNIVKLLQRGVQHNPPIPGRFSAPVMASMSARGLKKR